MMSSSKSLGKRIYPFGYPSSGGKPEAPAVPLLQIPQRGTVAAMNDVAVVHGHSQNYLYLDWRGERPDGAVAALRLPGRTQRE